VSRKEKEDQKSRHTVTVSGNPRREEANRIWTLGCEEGGNEEKREEREWREGDMQNARVLACAAFKL